jgi:uncharacterized protein (DUF58 family)
LKPTLRAVLIATLGIVPALLPAILDTRFSILWIGFAAATLVAIGLDLLAVPRPGWLPVELELPPVLYIGDEGRATVRVKNHHEWREVVVEIILDTGGVLPPVDAVRATVRPGMEGRIPIALHPKRRGNARVDALWLRWYGPLGLIRRAVRIPVDRDVPVVPNVRAVRAAALKLFRSKEFLHGLKPERYAGDGSEFDSLREFLPGFDHRAIDWKASARHVKLIAREYRSERNHQVIVGFDTGHLMAERLQGVPRLDHAMNAGLLLTWAALKTGDRVGLFAFDEQVRLFSHPRGGMPSFAALQRQTAGLDYSSGETNFTLGLMSLSRRLKRRTLIVLFTDFVDTVTAELMVENVGRLAARHLVLCITLKDPGLVEAATATPTSAETLSRAVVAGDLVREREVVLMRLRRLGIHCIDAPAKKVSTELVNRYLEIKRRELV